jgi:hypothetical protein
MSENESPDFASIRLMLAYLCIATEKEASLERKVEILNRFNLSTNEMAQVCNSKPQSVRNAVNTLKHASKSKKKA